MTAPYFTHEILNDFYVLYINSKTQLWPLLRFPELCVPLYHPKALSLECWHGLLNNSIGQNDNHSSIPWHYCYMDDSNYWSYPWWWWHNPTLPLSESFLRLVGNDAIPKLHSASMESIKANLAKMTTIVIWQHLIALEMCQNTFESCTNMVRPSIAPFWTSLRYVYMDYIVSPLDALKL